ncbi:3-oxoadipate enol-lactonase [Parasulfitobacter algicola]|uniref:3-oxoadipate enol-lactonase n=1 Tax=Parasulfitobacter algicola TaxID=2614809 RepID=UPI001FE5F90A|nr:3-oxoadipate enol-lactonase [Sulfitobacter algicola]
MSRDQTLERNGIKLFVREDGDANGAAVVFANSLGTDLRLWDQIIPLLPDGLRIVRYDKRGHGRSSVPPAPYAMGTLVGDAEFILDQLNIRDCVFVGLSIGGMIGQGLAVKRLDQVRGLVLSSTAAKIGTKEMWQDRMDAMRLNGIDAMANDILQRWFSMDFLQHGDLPFWRAMLVNTPLQGYLGCCAAIQGTDFYTPTSGLRLPTLGIAGSEDGATPPDLVRETIDLIPGSRFQLMRRVGHLPCAERPQDYARLLTEFLKEIGHV